MKIASPSPDFFHQIAGRDDAAEWINAMKKETRSLMDLRTFDVVDRVPTDFDENVIPSRFIFTVKRSGLKKARLVAGGHRQTIFDESTSSPTPDAMSLHLLLHVAVQKDLQLKSIDFDSAYLNSTLDKPMYMRPPAGFQQVYPHGLKEGQVLRLRKGLYGLKQAGLLWYQTLRNQLKQIKLKPAVHDPCLFKHEVKQLYLVVYVDDCVLVGTKTDIDSTIALIKRKFKLKESPLDDFLGMTITRHPNHVTLDLKKYESKAIGEFGLDNANESKTPSAVNTRLCPAQNEEDIFDRTTFMKFLGKLLWIAKLRPELDHVTNLLCRVAKAPQKDALTVMKRAFRYIKGHQSTLIFKKTNDMSITAYCDASFAEDHESKSHGGALLFLGSNLVAHYSRIQRHVTTSTAEAELTEIFRCCKETMVLRGLITDIGLKNPTTKVHSDSQSALMIIKGDTLKRSTKHLATKTMFCRELRENGTHDFLKVTSEENLADILTKSLPYPRFNELRSKIMSSRRADGCSAVEPTPLRVACATAQGARTLSWTEESNHECTAGSIRTVRTQLNTFCENKMLPKLKKIGDKFWNCYITTRQHFLGQ